MDFQWRQYLAELVGTFALTFAGTGAIIVNVITHNGVGSLGIAVAFGLVVMVMVYAFGYISGAHINPAVTLGFAVAKHFPVSQIPFYWISQFTGAIFSSLLLRTLFGNVARLGSTIPLGPAWVSFVLEAVLGFLLMLVITAVATGSKEIGAVAAIAIGGMVALGAIFAGPISGASMNPARSLAPAIVSGNLGFIWLYLTAPPIGAVLGALFYRAITSNAGR